jgi:hypothetical protein
MSWLVATEDRLSETIALRLLAEVGVSEDRARCFGRQGNGYLLKRLKNLNSTASAELKVLMLTDLDKIVCVAALLADWFGIMQRDANLIFRVAVREVEAWLMADRDNFASFLGISRTKVQTGVEALADPKRELLNLAKRSKARGIKQGLLPEKNAVAVQGFGYNDLLCDFVRKSWSAREASKNAPSLLRARRQIHAAVGIDLAEG